MTDDRAPFGINTTNRFVSPGAEDHLFRPYTIDDHGEIELVDYMGGDGTVERVATAGHGRDIFQTDMTQLEFIQYLHQKGITEPFRSVQLKFSFQCPIETALTFVYEPTANVNEYSGRYSVMINNSKIPTIEQIADNLGGDRNTVKERAREIQDLFNKGRENAYGNYEQLVDIDMARELARSGLGIDNDTRFYWKMDLLSLANFVHKQRKLLKIGNHSRFYVDLVADIAQSVAPYSWSALQGFFGDSQSLSDFKFPSDDEVVDGPLSPSNWNSSNTRRITVPSLENELFVRKKLLDHGEFQTVDYMGDDQSFAQAARTSYGAGTKALQDDLHLIRSLIRDLHTTPIEMAELAFEVKAPVFIDPRQAGRHRTLENHGFMGYTPLGSQFYFPPDSEFKYQDRLNRQGRGKDMDPEDRIKASALLRDTLESEVQTAAKLRELGVSEDIVRASKGVGFYTKRWRTGDAHNLNHFLMLRLDAHAQKEIRDLAVLVDEAHKLHVPTANEALHTYTIDGMRLSFPEIETLSRILGQHDESLAFLDLDNLDLYKGNKWIVPVDKEDPSKGKKLSREGEAFQRKLSRLIKNT